MNKIENIIGICGSYICGYDFDGFAVISDDFGEVVKAREETEFTADRNDYYEILKVENGKWVSKETIESSEMTQW